MQSVGTVFIYSKPRWVSLCLSLKSQTGVVTKATYGGTAAPFNEAAAIRDFFVEEVPDAPDAMIKCYEPVGPPFAP